MKVRIKKLHHEAVIPKYALEGDAGMDLTATSARIDETYNFIEYGTGIAIQIPKNHVGLLIPRSSVSKTNMILANSCGVIDSNFTGEIKVRFHDFELSKNDGKFYAGEYSYEVGDRIAQLLILPYPQIQFEEVNELTETVRGSGGFGSTNK